MELLNLENLRQFSHGARVLLPFSIHRADTSSAINDEGDTWEVRIVKPRGGGLIIKTTDLEFPEDTVMEISALVEPLDFDRKGTYYYQVIKTTDGAFIASDVNEFEVKPGLPIGLPFSAPNSPLENFFPIFGPQGQLLQSLFEYNPDTNQLFLDGNLIGGGFIVVADYVSLPGTGEDGKIYLTLDDNQMYYWSIIEERYLPIPYLENYVDYDSWEDKLDKLAVEGYHAEGSIQLLSNAAVDLIFDGEVFDITPHLGADIVETCQNLEGALNSSSSGKINRLIFTYSGDAPEEISFKHRYGGVHQNVIPYDTSNHAIADPSTATLVNGTDGLFGLETLFAYCEAETITSPTPVPIPGCEITVEGETYYQVDIQMAIVNPSPSPGDISTDGTAVFTGNMMVQIYTAAGGEASSERFTNISVLNVDSELLVKFSGIIKTTDGGTISLEALAINGPGDAFEIESVRMVFRKIKSI